MRGQRLDWATNQSDSNFRLCNQMIAQFVVRSKGAHFIFSLRLVRETVFGCRKASRKLTAMTLREERRCLDCNRIIATILLK